ncbi:hypothetical protein MPER_05496, partial [Moniliophthora perniciosa FA553]
NICSNPNTISHRKRPNARSLVDDSDRTPALKRRRLNATAGLPHHTQLSPYYSDEQDVPAGPREYAGLTFELNGGDGLANVEEWVQESTVMPLDGNGPEDPPALSVVSYDGWEFAGLPPSVKQVKKWLLSADGARKDSKGSDFQSQIKGPTQNNIYGMQSTPMIANAEGGRVGQNMSVLSLEVF